MNRILLLNVTTLLMITLHFRDNCSSVSLLSCLNVLFKLIACKRFIAVQNGNTNGVLLQPWLLPMRVNANDWASKCELYCATFLHLYL